MLCNIDRRSQDRKPEKSTYIFATEAIIVLNMNILHQIMNEEFVLCAVIQFMTAMKVDLKVIMVI